MTPIKSILRLGTLGLLAFAIVVTPELSRAGDSDTNAVPTVKHKKKKTADTNAPVVVIPKAAPDQAKTVAPVKPAAATDATTAKAGHNKSGVLPFHGKLKEANVAGKTISVGVRTFVINSDTLITKDGKTATLADGVVGDEVGGAYKKTEDGKLVITKLRFGAKVATEPGVTK
jgi:hypothetical protein